MHVSLELIYSEDYFKKTNREIDYNGNDRNKVPLKQSELLQQILSTEASIHVLRRVTGLCGLMADTMSNVRNKLISKYEENYEPYIRYRDFH